MRNTRTFYAVFKDMEDERPDAFFWHEEEAREYLEHCQATQYGDVLPFTMLEEDWMHFYLYGRLTLRRENIERSKYTLDKQRKTRL